MTWSRFAAGAEEVRESEVLSCGTVRTRRHPAGVAHAVPVPVPVTHAPTEAVCGVRVTALPHLDWQAVWGVPRCPRCRSAAG